MLNTQRLFYSSIGTDSFYDAILPNDQQKLHLTACKNKIRDHLRAGIESVSVTILAQENKVSPRFRTQGSWSYNTCNQPAHIPPQEMDWDLGVYLPTSVWEDSHPKVAASIYFKLVEGLLLTLCQREGWKIVPRETCVRVIVGMSCHIDVPLYAAPDNEFRAIQERVAKAIKAQDDSSFSEARAQGELVDQDWDSLKHIVLATREGEWKASDPGVVSDWFRHQIAEHGEQLRRICRYLKAWRDFHWTEGGPSSVLLMICACQVFKAVHGRDDLALKGVCEHLGTMLAGDVHEELINSGEQFNKLTPQERPIAEANANNFYRIVSNALAAHAWQKQDANKALQQQFGPRLPYKPDWITDDTPQSVVRATSAVVVPQPIVKPTKAG